MRRSVSLRPAWLLFACLSLASPLRAQLLSAPTVTNTGDGNGTSCNGVCGASICEAERDVALSTVSSGATSFRVRYAQSIIADCGQSSQEWSYSMNSAYRVNFNATCPVGYRLSVSSERKGAVIANVENGGDEGHAFLGAVTGSASPTLTTGSLAMSAIAAADSGGSSICHDVNQSSSGTIVGVSNGAAIAHILNFSWSSDVRSQGFAFNSGDEGCVILGEQADTIGSIACDDYNNLGGCGTPPNPRNINNDGHFAEVTLACLCGDGVNDGAGAGEQCDEGAANGTAGSCCTSTCQLKANGVECRASAGLCDTAESCNGSSGSCPTDTLVSNGTPCRPSTGECDATESCNGSSPSCPSDSFVPSGTQCSDTNSADCFDAQCNGSGSCIQTNGFESASYTCRASGGSCDLAETCSGSSGTCPSDSKVTAGTVCRASAFGECDPSEACDGITDACPSDSFVDAGTPCTDSDTTDCSDARCNGSGLCDQAYQGEANGHVCRASAGECDAAETCSGSPGPCPGNGFVAAGTQCSDSATGDCFDAQCDGSGTCSQTFGVETNAYTCRPSAGVCDQAELCDGSATSCPVDAFLPDSSECRASAGECDSAEFCTGSAATCPGDSFVSAGTVCADATSSDCFDARCDGTGACDQNYGVEVDTYVCRASAGECDPEERCNGATGLCPTDSFVSAGTLCSDSTSGDCFEAQCDGAGACDQDFALEANGHVCRAAVDVCDAAETCNGAIGSCPADGFQAATTVCRPSADAGCGIAETCTGSSVTCPPDVHVSNGTTCNDHDGCSLVDTCQGGVCTGGSLATCSDGFTCTVDSCVSTGDTTRTCDSTTVAAGSCLIDGHCWDDGELNPDNECQACDPGSHQNDWFDRPEGTLCALTFGECDGQGVCEEPMADCEPTPRADCRTSAPGSGKIVLRDNPVNSHDGVGWKFKKGGATSFLEFGDPVRSTNYSLCIYDDRVPGPEPQLVKRFDIPAGGTCKDSAPCWRSANNKKYLFRDQRKPTPIDGIAKIILTPGEEGKTKITLLGRGEYVLPPLLPLTEPAVAQLVNSRGECWEHRYSSPFRKAEGPIFIDSND